jgi:hypothetical protein
MVLVLSGFYFTLPGEKQKKGQNFKDSENDNAYILDSVSGSNLLGSLPGGFFHSLAQAEGAHVRPYFVNI